MLQKTRGVVLNYLRYRETSIIVRIYTEEFGLQSYIENGVRTAKGRNKMALFQPLTLLDLVVYFKKDGGIQRISETKIAHPYHGIPFDIAKSSIGLFVSEILGKTLKEETGNPALFGFLTEALVWLDDAETGYENFHLWFLLRLSGYLGFAPENPFELAQQLRDAGLPVYDLDGLAQLEVLQQTPEAARLDRPTRGYLLDLLTKFYGLHIDGFGEVKSQGVLQEVLR
jgi:DNA repair protein RecO (recombination protein O)